VVTSLWRAQMRSLPLWKFQLGFKYFFKCFGLRKKPHPQGNSIPSVWGEGGGKKDILLNCQMVTK